MITFAASLALMLAAALAAFACVFAVVLAVQFTSGRKHGYFHWVIPTMLFITALGIALSGRTFEVDIATQMMIKHPLVIWTQRVATIFILTVSAERIINHFSARRNLLGAAPLLTIAFATYWFCSQLSPMFLSAHPRVFHEPFYALIIGIGALLLDGDEAEVTLKTARNALLLFLLAGYFLLPIKPNLVLDSNYSQGYIPGLPRFAGLATHAVTLGMLSQLALLCVWARPYANRNLNRAAWCLGLLTLFIAQSKTGWVSFCICATVMFLCQNGHQLKQKLIDPRRPELSITLICAAMLMLSFFGAYALFGDMGDKITRFLNSESGAQLTSLTGRDLIWSAAYQEWMRHPLFGYGPDFLSGGYRLSVGLPNNAIHGHNQYMDLLPRAGLVGAIPLTFYLLALLNLSIRHAVASRGLTLALFLALGLRAVSEIPLTLNGYGQEFSSHLLLLILLPAFNALALRKASQTASAEMGSRPDLQFSRARPQT